MIRAEHEAYSRMFAEFANLFFIFFSNSRIREFVNTRNALRIHAKHREIAKGVKNANS